MPRRLWLSVVVPVALALLTSFAVYRMLLTHTRSLQQVSDTRVIESDLNALMRVVVDAETGERGFIITGNESFLTPYTTSTRDFGTVLSRLRRQLPEQGAVLSEIDALFESWRREVAEVAIRARRRTPVGLASSLDAASDAFSAARAVELRVRLTGDQTLLTRLTSFLDESERALTRAQELDHTGQRRAALQSAQAALERYRSQLGPDLGANAAARDETAPALRDALMALAREATATEAQIAQLIQTGAGKERIDRIRLLVDRTLGEAERRLERDLLLSDLSSRRAQTLALVGPLFAAFISFYATLQGQRRLKASVHQLAAVAKEVASGQLGKRLTLAPGDDLGGLAADFNRMAESLAERERQTTLLVELSSALQTCLTAEEAYRVSERYAASLFAGLSGTLYVLRASRNLMACVAHWGEPHEGGALPPRRVGPSGAAARSRRGGAAPRCPARIYRRPLPPKRSAYRLLAKTRRSASSRSTPPPRTTPAWGITPCSASPAPSPRRSRSRSLTSSCANASANSRCATR